MMKATDHKEFNKMESSSTDSSIQYRKRDKIIRGGRGKERHLVEMGEEGNKGLGREWGAWAPSGKTPVPIFPSPPSTEDVEGHLRESCYVGEREKMSTQATKKFSILPNYQVMLWWFTRRSWELRRLRQEDCPKFEASLGYIWSSRMTSTTVCNPVSKNIMFLNF